MIELPYQERAARIMFLREHRRNLISAFCRVDVEKKEKGFLEQERANVETALEKLDPDGMFPP